MRTRLRTTDPPREANAFRPMGRIPTHIIAALPEVDNDVAVAAFRDQSTNLARDAAREDERFADELMDLQL